MHIEVIAPTRIDLAGGTIDIWPLYLLEDGAITINMAIDKFVKVDLTTRHDKKIVLISEDLKLKRTYRAKRQGRNFYPFGELRKLKRDRRLSLIERIIDFYSPPTGITVVTKCGSPYGSGLGQSSALNIALNVALNILTEKRLNNKEIINVARDIESQVLHNPAGLQDYYPAVYGGIEAIRLEIGKVIPERLSIDNALIKERFILCNTGKSRFSVLTNWKMVKGYLENDLLIKKAFSKIKANAICLRDALLEKDINGIKKSLDDEWNLRKKMGNNIITKKMEDIFKRLRRIANISAHVCGAGGGGCMVFFLVDYDSREKIEQCIKECNTEVLDFNISKKGYVTHFTN